MIKSFFVKLGNMLIAVLKALAWLVLHVLILILSVLKLFLILLSLVSRLVFGFMRGCTL